MPFSLGVVKVNSEEELRYSPIKVLVRRVPQLVIAQQYMRTD